MPSSHFGTATSRLVFSVIFATICFSSEAVFATARAADYCDANRPACIQAVRELDAVDAEHDDLNSFSGAIVPQPQFVNCWKPYVEGLQELAKLYTADWKALVVKGTSINQAKITAIQKFITSYRNLTNHYNQCYKKPGTLLPS